MDLISWIVLILLIAIAAILIVPIRASFQVIKDGLLVRGFYKVAWFGLTLTKGELPPPESGLAEGGEQEKPPEEGGEVGMGPLEPVLKDPDLIMDAIPGLINLVKDSLRAVSVDGLYLHMDLGLQDPAKTAVTMGHLYSAAAVVCPGRAQVSIHPYWYGEKFDGSMLTEIGIRLLWLVMAGIRAMMDASVRKLLMTMAKGGRKKEERDEGGPRRRCEGEASPS